MKKGFTLIELLVVIGMIAVLTGAASSAVMKARKRSQIARAEAETQEMTNAILAYENYDAGRMPRRILCSSFLAACRTSRARCLSCTTPRYGAVTCSTLGARRTST